VIQVGDVLRGKYRLESSIGRGGMGEVFCAHDMQANRRVAVKVVSRTIIGDILMARLQREAIAAVRVRSDYVPQLLDVDTTEDGEVFLVMELLRGQTLTARLKQRGNLTWEETLALGSDVLHGLIDAHAAGVVHRDLKPSNIFLELARPGSGERAKILDFGVCKLDAPDGEKLTTTGESVGTVAYMAPEQIRGASKVDQRADLYSFGTVVFEALSGRMAHDASGQMALLASKLERPALRLSDCSLAPLPDGLDSLIARTLARDPNERPSTAVELLGLWESLGHATIEPRTQPVLTLDPDLDGPGLPGATQTSLTAGTGTMMTRGGHAQSRVPLVVAAGAVAMSLGVFGAMLGARAPGPQPTGPTSAPPSDELTAFRPADPAGGHAGGTAADPGKTSDELAGAIPGAGAGSAAPGPWVPVPLVVELPADSGANNVRTTATRPVRRTFGKSTSTGTTTTTRRPATEPRIDDKPRY
jgi:hypothetical protein